MPDNISPTSSRSRAREEPWTSRRTVPSRSLPMPSPRRSARTSGESGCSDPKSKRAWRSCSYTTPARPLSGDHSPTSLSCSLRPLTPWRASPGSGADKSRPGSAPTPRGRDRGGDSAARPPAFAWDVTAGRRDIRVGGACLNRANVFGPQERDGQDREREDRTGDGWVPV